MSSIKRHNWIEEALAKFRFHFAECGYTVPANVRVSVGFTKSNNHTKSLGQCVDKAMSTDGHYELFISPVDFKLVDKALAVNILETVAHELVHATVGNEHGHQGAFIGCAAAVGFNRPWKFTPAGEKMLGVIERIIVEQGLFPAGAITLLKKPQGKSLIKCQCECGFKAYVTNKMMQEFGVPLCPQDFVAMECE